MSTWEGPSSGWPGGSPASVAVAHRPEVMEVIELIEGEKDIYKLVNLLDLDSEQQRFLFTVGDVDGLQGLTKLLRDRIETWRKERVDDFTKQV